jgi:hypothetical protein
VVETEVRAAGASQDREGAADNRSPVSVVPVEEDSPAVSLSRVNADRVDNRPRAVADFPVQGASLEADKDSRVAAGRDSRASAAFLEVKDSGVVIAGISGVAIADIIAVAIAPTDTAMDTTPVTATTAVIMAGPIATPMATMIDGAIGIPTLSAVTTLTPTGTATS